MDGEDFKAPMRDVVFKKLGEKGAIAHSTLSVIVGPYPDKLLRAFMDEVSRAGRSEEEEIWD
jgi:hypothetical protein